MAQGRPCKLTPDIQQTIVQAIKLGSYVETASALAGINKETFYRWLKQGARAKTGKFKAFSNAVKKAVATAELRDLAVIAEAAHGYDTTESTEKKKYSGATETTTVTKRVRHWQAAAWRLERKYPQRWGRKSFVETHESEEPIAVPEELTDRDLESLPDEALVKIIEMEKVNDGKPNQGNNSNSGVGSGAGSGSA